MLIYTIKPETTNPFFKKPTNTFSNRIERKLHFLGRWKWVEKDYNLPFFQDDYYHPSVSADVGKVRVKTLLGANQLYSEVVKLIEEAQKNIKMVMFSFTDSIVTQDQKPKGNKFAAEKQEKLLQLLIDKKRKNPNLKIQIVLDSARRFAALNGHQFQNQKMTMYLKQHNIDVLPYPPNKEGGAFAMHNKFLSIDDKKVFFGSPSFDATTPEKHESSLLIENRIPNQNSEVDNLIEQIFNKDWNFAQQKNRNLLLQNKEIISTYTTWISQLFKNDKIDQYFKPADSVNPLTNPSIKILVSHPEASQKEKFNPLGQYIFDKLSHASSVRIASGVVCDPQIVERIIKRQKEALQGGKPFDCKIILSPHTNIGGINYGLLKKSGVPVILFPHIMHSKWALFDDGELFLGSPHMEPSCLRYNFRGTYWDRSKMTNNKLYKGNRESAIVIKNEILNETFLKQFNKDWQYSLESNIKNGVA